jgi:hypothetical protein
VLAVAASLIAAVLFTAQLRSRGQAAGQAVAADSLPHDTAITEPVAASSPPPPESSVVVTPVTSSEPRPTPELRIVAPAAAEVHVDGRRVGRGSWRGAGLAPGEHKVSAAVNTIPGCPSAREDAAVRVATVGPTEITLAPRPCGSITLDIQDGAQWWLTEVPAGREVASGRAPVTAPVVLPEGIYVLRVAASYCADYRGDVRITGDSSQHARVRLICGSTAG